MPDQDPHRRPFRSGTCRGTRLRPARARPRPPGAVTPWTGTGDPAPGTAWRVSRGRRPPGRRAGRTGTPQGRQRAAGTTGANSETTGVPTAAARCAGPVLPTTTASAPAQHGGQLGQVGAAAEVDGTGERRRTRRRRGRRTSGDHDGPARRRPAPSTTAARVRRIQRPRRHGGARVDDDVRRAGQAGRRPGQRCPETQAAVVAGREDGPAASARARAAVTSCPPSGPPSSAAPSAAPAADVQQRAGVVLAGRATRGTPASRHSSAIGSGLWWNEVKTTASSYDRSRSCATRASTGRDRSRGSRTRTTAGRRRSTSSTPAAGARRPGPRGDQQVDAGTVRGEGADRRAGQQHVAVAVEPHREDPAASSPRPAGAARPRATRSAPRPGQSRTSSGRVTGRGHEHGARTGRPRSLDVGADVPDHRADPGVDAAASGAAASTRPGRGLRHAQPVLGRVRAAPARCRTARAARRPVR